MKNQKTGKRGFTIVELVIVIAVIAILAAVLIPRFITVINSANNINITINERNEKTNQTIEKISGGITIPGKNDTNNDNESGSKGGTNPGNDEGSGSNPGSGSDTVEVGEIKQSPETDVCHVGTKSEKYNSINEALASASGDTVSIRLDAKLYNAKIDLTTKNITLDGGNELTCYLNGNKTFRNNSVATITILGGTHSGKIESKGGHTIIIDGENFKSTGNITAAVGKVILKSGDFSDATISAGAGYFVQIDGGTFKDGQHIVLASSSKTNIKINSDLVKTVETAGNENTLVTLKTGEKIYLEPTAGKAITHTSNTTTGYHEFTC